MDSPINPAVPQLLTNATLGVIGVVSLLSLYHQRYRMLSATNASFTAVKRGSEEEKVEELQRIAARLQDATTSKKADVILSSECHGKDLLSLAVLQKDGSNASSVVVACQLISRVFGQSNKGKQQMARLNAPRILLTSLSVAHSLGLVEPLEATALALRDLTTFNDDKVILIGDTPEGAECAASLARIPSISNMLTILDPESPVTFLTAAVSVLANVCSLHAGAKALSKGTPEHSGISFFLHLLDHCNMAVVAKSMDAIAYLCRANCGREDLIKQEHMDRIAANFSAKSEKTVIQRVLTIIMIMAGDEANSKVFFERIPNTSMLRTMFDVWVSGEDADTRGRAEMVACLCLQVPSTSKPAMELLQAYRRRIVDRNQKDEAEKQKKMQEAQQQQFMQRMMMEQMGMM